MEFITKVNRLPASFYLIIALLFFNLGCDQQFSERKITGELIRVDSINAPIPDASIDSIISFYRDQLQKEMSQVIGFAPYSMHRASPEGLLNNFVADLVLEFARTVYKPEDGQPIDFCLLNFGGLRSSLPAGEITVGNVFELMPFDNTIVVLTLSGDKIKEMFHYLSTETNGMPISGLRMGILDKKPVNIEINGEPFDQSRNYKVVTSDFLSKGGDRMNFFLEPIRYEALDMQIRDAILLHIKNQTAKGNKIFSQLDGRLFIAN